MLERRAGGTEEIELGGAHVRGYGSHADRVDGCGWRGGLELEACLDEQDLRVGGGCSDSNAALLERVRGEAKREMETAAGKAAQRKPCGQAVEAAAEHKGERLDRVDAGVQDYFLF
jgi:hypothetical protein